MPAVRRRPSNDETIRAKCFFVEEVSRFQAFVHLAVVVLLFKLRGVYSQFRKQAAGFGAVRKRRFDRNRAAICEQHVAVDVKLIALGMSTKVIVVVENQDARRRILFAVKISCGQAAHAAARDDQIIGLSGIDWRARIAPEITVAGGVRGLERSVMASTHAGERRRVVIGFVLGKLLGAFGHPFEARQETRTDGGPYRDCDAV